MTCRYCGEKLPSDAKRCPVCGMDVPRRAARKQSMNGLGLAIALATFAILAVAVCVAMFSNRGSSPEYAQVLDRYFKALETRDASLYASTRPQAYVDYLLRSDGGSYPNYTVYLNDLAVTINNRVDGYETACGSNIRITYRIDQALDMDPYLSRIGQVLAGWYGFRQGSVSQALMISGSYTVRGSAATQRYEITDTLLLKIDDAWYFAPDIGQSWRN